MMGWQWHHSWTICKLFAPRSRKKPHQHFNPFYGPDTFMMSNQPFQSTEGINSELLLIINYFILTDNLSGLACDM